MCDVDKHNLDDLLPAIENAIKTCDFIAFDTEFTTLVGSRADKPSLFDDMQARYQKNKNNMTKAAICQIGLSTFQKNPNDNSQYTVKTFNFYVCPQSFSVIDPHFTCQASSLQFLVRYQFDFNKFIYDGISYMNEVQEKQLQNHLNLDKMFTGLERSFDEDAIQRVCSTVAEWTTTCEEGDEMTLDKTELSDIPPYVMKKELLLRFPRIFIENRKDVFRITKTIDLGKPVPQKDMNSNTSGKGDNSGTKGGNTNVIQDSKGDNTDTKGSNAVVLQDTKGDNAQTKGDNTVLDRDTSVGRRDSSSDTDEVSPVGKSPQVLDKMLGFTKVFRVMKEHKKPLIGHNMFLDLMLLYEKFHKPLPSKYTDFKAELHRIFPVVYDTKHISASIRRPLESTGLYQKTMLELLYKQLDSRIGREAVIHTPTIKQDKAYNKYKVEDSNIPHEAGWDAYMCGYVFLRTAHIITFIDTKSADVTPCTFHRYVTALSPYENRINLIRGCLNYFRLDGPDPVSERPDLLYLSHRKLWQKIDIEQVASLMSKYGSVDVQPLGRSRALVAPGNFTCAKDILKGFKKNSLYQVTKYRVWKHSNVAQGLLWSGLLVSGGVCAWALLSGNKKQ